MAISQLGPAVSGIVLDTSQHRHLAVAAYLARFKGQTRIHTESDLRSYLDWCEQRGLNPLQATRPHIELYLRWLQEVRRHRPSTVSRRMSVVAGFYRTCVIDSVLEHSPADYTCADPTSPLSHPPWASPTCSLRHYSPRPDSPAIAATSPSSPCSASSACASSKPPAATSNTWARNMGTAYCGLPARATRSSSCRYHRPLARPSKEPSRTGRAVPSC